MKNRIIKTNDKEIYNILNDLEKEGCRFKYKNIKPTKFRFFDRHKGMYKNIILTIEDNKIYFKCNNEPK